MTVTKIGIMPALPAPKNIAYYTADASVTLLSIGNLCQNGGEAHQTATGLKLYDVSGPTPTLLDYSLSQANNLSPVSPDFWLTRRSGTGVSCAYWTDIFTPEAVSDPTILLLDTELWAYHSAPNPNRHYTAVELARADEVQHLHEVYAHLNDHDLGVALDYGLIRSPSNCTSHDVAINRVLRLNCPQCLEGKMKHPHYSPSTAQLAEDVGSTLQLDITQLPTASAVTGNTHELMIVDDKTGEISIVSVTDKTGPAILHATLKFIASHYTAYGHKTSKLAADAETIFKSMIPLIGKSGYALTLMPPQQHAQRLERYQQTLQNRFVATLATVPLYFPKKYYVQLRSAVAYIMSLTLIR